MISYYPKFICLSATLHELSPQNELRILTFKRPPCSYLLFLTKMVSLKVVHPLKIYQYTKFHVPTLIGASFVSISEVWKSAIWNGWRYWIKKYGVDVTFNDMTSLLNFIKIYQLIQSYYGGTDRRTDGQTDRQTGDLINLTFLFKESWLKMISVQTCAADIV
jgi:hypothetical protein